MSKTDEMIAEAVESALENREIAQSAAHKQMLAGGVLALGGLFVTKVVVNRRASRKARKIAKTQEQ